MLILNFILLLMGLFLVVKGADILISSAVTIGKKYGVSDFFIGLIIIGFGTSLPELLVSIDAIIKNHLKFPLETFLVQIYQIFF